MSCGRKSCGSERAAGSGQGADSGCRIAQFDGWIGEKFLLRVLNYPGIAFLAAELFDIPHVHGFTFQQEGLSDGSAHDEYLHFKEIRAAGLSHWRVSVPVRSHRQAGRMFSG